MTNSMPRTAQGYVAGDIRTCPCECHKSQSWCCEKCSKVCRTCFAQLSIEPHVEACPEGLMNDWRAGVDAILSMLSAKIAAIESSPMMKLKARCNKCGKEVNPASPEHLCLVPGGVIVNA